MKCYEEETTFYSQCSSFNMKTSFKKSSKNSKPLIVTPKPKFSQTLSLDSVDLSEMNIRSDTNEEERVNSTFRPKRHKTLKGHSLRSQNNLYDEVIKDLELSLRSGSSKDKAEVEKSLSPLPQRLASSYTNTQVVSNFYEYTENCMRLIVKLKQRKEYHGKKVSFSFDMKEKKLALFDLDETLIHCTNGKGKGDHKLLVTLPGNKQTSIEINIRPHWKKTIKQVREKYHIVVYTASHQSYADAVLDYLDPLRKYFNHRLYRTHCILEEIDGQKFYIKDMEIFEGVDLKDIIIIDNSVLSFAYHLDSGVSIIPFYDNRDDYEMLLLSHYLVSIASSNDLRAANREHLQLSYFYNQAKEEYNEETTEASVEDSQQEGDCIINRRSNTGSICDDFQDLFTNLRNKLKVSTSDIVVE